MKMLTMFSLFGSLCKTVTDETTVKASGYAVSKMDENGEVADIAPNRLLELTAEEQAEYDKFLNDPQSTEHRCIQEDLEAFVGAELVLSYIHKDSDDSTEQSGSDKGIILLEGLDAELIKLVCDNLYDRIREANHHDDDCPEKHLKIAIHDSIMKEYKKDCLPYISDSTAAAHRNTSEPGIRKLCAVSEDYDKDTLKHITDRISINAFHGALIKYLRQYLEHNSEKVNLPVGALSEDNYAHLEWTLETLCDKLDLSLESLASYVVLLLKSFAKKQHHDDRDLRVAIGESLSVLSLPVRSLLLSDSSYETCSKDIYQQRIEDYIKSVGNLKDISFLSETDKQFQTLLSNFTSKFSQEKLADSIGNSTQLIDLSDLQRAFIKRYLQKIKASGSSRPDEEFKRLCTIEWKDKLSVLFDDGKSKRSKEGLWSRTEAALRKATLAGETDEISEEERKQIPSIVGRKSPSDEQLKLLHDFYYSHKSWISKDRALDREWNSEICKDRYSDSNFILMLVQSMIDKASSMDEVKVVELRLTTSRENLRLFNEAAIGFFNLRFGSYLKRLQDLLGDKFVITVAAKSKRSAVVSEKTGSLVHKESDRLSLAIINYRAYIEQNPLTEGELSKESKQKRKKNNTLNFEMHFIKEDGSSELAQLIWTYSSEWQHLDVCKDLNDLIAACSPKSTDEAKGIELVTGTYTPILFDSLGNRAVFDLASSASFNVRENVFKFESEGSTCISIANKAEAIIRGLQPTLSQGDSKTSFDEKIELVAALFSDFKHAYLITLRLLSVCKLRYCHAKELSELYTKLQVAIIDARADGATTYPQQEDLLKLLQLVLMVGMAYPSNAADDTAIATPFAVESMRSYTAKLERLTDIIYKLVNDQMSLGNRDLFIESLNKDIAYFDGSELCVPSTLSSNTKLSFFCIKQEAAGYTQYNRVDSSAFMSSLTIGPNDYAQAICSYLEHYFKNRPILSDLFVVMLRDCIDPDVVVAIFKALHESKDLSKAKLKLLVVNDDSRTTAEIYKQFEILRTSGSFLVDNKKISVSILTSTDKPDLYGTYEGYLNDNRFACNEARFKRVADITVQIHTFDKLSKLEYISHSVPVIRNEIEIKPSLVNRNNTDMISANAVGKFLVNQVQTIPRIQFFNSIALCNSFGIAAYQDFANALSVVKKLMEKKDDNVSSLTTFLPHRQASKEHRFFVDTDMIRTVHEQSEVVVFIDELQCRRLIIEDDRRLIYYNKIKDSEVNLLVSSAAERNNFMSYMKELYFDVFQCSNGDNDFIAHVEKDAIAISGGLLMRAETGHKATYELIGNVMCKYIAEQISSYMINAMGLSHSGVVEKPVTVSLDDYHFILVGAQCKHADILSLQVFERTQRSEGDNQYVLIVSAIESKFLTDLDTNSANKSKSQTDKSLMALVEPIKNNSADRSQQLSKFADILADNCLSQSPAQNQEFAAIQKAIREEQIDIMFMGFSFVFAKRDELSSGDAITAIASPNITDVDNDHRLVQVHMHHNAVRELFEDYKRNRCSSHITSNRADSSLLSRWLEEDSMQDLKRYLTDKRPKIFALHPAAEDVDKGRDLYGLGGSFDDEASILKMPTQGSFIESLESLTNTEDALNDVSSSTVATVSEEPPKRKRGRPRKSDQLAAADVSVEVAPSSPDADSTDAGSTAVDVQQVEEPPKRKRGRPRKSDQLAAADSSVVEPPSSSDADTTVVDVQQVEEPPKRKRGRPRKSEQQATTDSAAATAPSSVEVALIAEGEQQVVEPPKRKRGRPPKNPQA